MLVKSIVDMVGNTPIIPLRDMPGEAEIYLKMEMQNPTSSVKDRLALALILDAEEQGLLDAESRIVEATSGNTGVAMAAICAEKGYKITLTMPESMSIERRRIVTALGADVRLTPAHEGMRGAIDEAEEIIAKNPNALSLKQFDNQANPRFHENTTGPEIWSDLNGRVDVFIAGVGTGGTFTGCTRFLKSRNPDLHAIAVEPKGSAVLSGESPGPHKIQGIGAGFIPATMDASLIDEIIQVDAEDAGRISRNLAQSQGLFMGVSGGANVWAAMEVARRPQMQGKVMVTVGCDFGERYLSTWLFQ